MRLAHAAGAGALGLLAGCARVAAGDEVERAVPRGAVLALGPEALARRDGVGFELAPGGAVSVAVDAPGGGRLVVEREREGGARLELAVAVADLASGGTRPLGPPRPLAADGAADLPAGAGAPLVVELAAVGPPGGVVRVRRVALREPPRPRPSIVFVSIDTLAARHLSAYGYGRPTSPNLERLAREAVLFEHCVANAPSTSPSYASQLTGLYASTFSRGRVPKGEVAWWVPPERWTLAERLAAAGWRTAAFVDNPFADERFGLAQGFGVFDTTAAAVPTREVDGGLRLELPLALAWLDALPPGAPFLLLLQALDCHLPYLPPPRTAGAFAAEADPARTEPVAPRIQCYGHVPRLQLTLAGVDPPPERVPVEPLVAAYDEEVLDVDLALGELLDALRARGLYDDAILVFSADHGESLLEHEWYFEHGQNHEEVLHVPLVVRLPGGRHGGTRVAETVQLVDLVPTLLELAGVDAGDAPLHGRSLVPLLEGGALPPAPVLAGPDVSRGHALVHDGWKLVRTWPARALPQTALTHPLARDLLAERAGLDGRPEAEQALALVAAAEERDAVLEELRARLSGPIDALYDLRADPHETRDLAAAEPERLADLRRRLARELARVEAARRLPATGPTPGTSAGVLADLRALGYADDG